jgi:SEC-C motif
MSRKNYRYFPFTLGVDRDILMSSEMALGRRENYDIPLGAKSRDAPNMTRDVQDHGGGSALTTDSTPEQKRLIIRRSDGVTETERDLKELCDHTFLSLWSYPNVYRYQGGPKEVCDLLVVFQNHIVIFSDKKIGFSSTGNLKNDWGKWFNKAIRGAARQIYGAERQIKDFPQGLFLGRDCKQRFPIPLPDPSTAIYHRIVVAHGVSKRFREHSGGDGSLLIDPTMKYRLEVRGNEAKEDCGKPFTIGQFFPEKQEPKGFIHVFDARSLAIVMQTLDTITDFTAYLSKKEQLVHSGRLRFVAGEDNLLAFYLRHRNSDGEYDFPLKDNEQELIIERGRWDDFVNSPRWKAQSEENRVSYEWDRLIECFNQQIMEGSFFVLHPTSSLTKEQMTPEWLMRFLAQESRFRRRVLARALAETIELARPSKPRFRVAAFPDSQESCYLFLVFCRHLKQKEWQITLNNLTLCAKLLNPQVQDIIGIGIKKDATRNTSEPKATSYFDARFWSKEIQAEAKQILSTLPLSEKLTQSLRIEFEYPVQVATPVPSHTPTAEAVVPMKGRNRNAPCPCGSGKKYKKCHGR